MDNSAFEALKIGTYIFIFMIAITASFTLMGTVNDMVEFTRNGVIASADTNLVEHLGGNVERTYTGTELLALYGQQRENKLPAGIEIYVNTGVRNTLENYIKGYTNYNSIFKLEYEEGNKWVFVKQ